MGVRIVGDGEGLLRKMRQEEKEGVGCWGG